jgi:alkylhydroperoxidase family enzyme
MSRISPVRRSEAPDDVIEIYDKVFGSDREPADDPGTSTGTPGDWYTTWAHTPDILAAFGAVKDPRIAPELKSLAIMRTGYVCQSQFVYSQHCKLARVNGVDESKIRDIPYWAISDAYSALERQILAFTDAMNFENGRVHKQLFDKLRKALPEDQILSLGFFINLYTLHARTCRAFRLEYDNVPERIVEIPKPDAPGVQDWTNGRWTQD